MMFNLFSIFDPYNFLKLFLNWGSSVLLIFLIPQSYWIFNSWFMNFLKLILKNLFNEFKVIMLKKFNLNNLIFFNVLFMFIMMNNFLGLFPYIFTSSSHMVFAVSFSLSMWVSVMIFGWVKNTKFMLIHLVPQGTPIVLMSFMVLIELLSNLIRPLTLSIRLTANMVAGHLLLTLLGGGIPDFFLFYLFLLMIQLMLMILELGVSLIQSYVFVILMILYLKETN